MKNSLLILCLFCATLALAAAVAVGNPELDAEWEDFKQRYGKEYGVGGDEEDADEEVRIFDADGCENPLNRTKCTLTERKNLYENSETSQFSRGCHYSKPL